VAKLRHSGLATRQVRSAAFRIVGEDGYNPHTALELYRIADMTVSYFSSGVVEAVACGSFHLNVRPPWYFNDVHEEVFPIYRHFYPQGGVNCNLEAAEAVSALPTRSISDYALDDAARERYLTRLAGTLDGKNSGRFLAALRAFVRGSRGDAVA
jgi:hypothetical protein